MKLEQMLFNIRSYASLKQLLILANLENLNSEYIKAGIEQKERLVNLNRVAIEQMKMLSNQKTIDELTNPKKNY